MDSFDEIWPQETIWEDFSVEMVVCTVGGKLQEGSLANNLTLCPSEPLPSAPGRPLVSGSSNVGLGLLLEQSSGLQLIILLNSRNK